MKNNLRSLYMVDMFLLIQTWLTIQKFTAGCVNALRTGAVPHICFLRRIRQRRPTTTGWGGDK